MDTLLPFLHSLEEQQESLLEQISDWSSINSGSGNIAGVQRMAERLQKRFDALGFTTRLLPLPPYEKVGPDGHVVPTEVGPALRATWNPDGPLKLLLSAHLDTVFPEDSPFQTPKRDSDNRLVGPGVADIKGGIAVMLAAVTCLLESPLAKQVCLEVVLNPDEEIGSPSSAALLRETARRCDYGLIFEPSLPDGTYVSERKGSANFTLVSRGTSAHAGRAWAEGSSAIRPLARVIDQLEEMNDGHTMVNVGTIHGGTASNVVPDLAIATVNIRTTTAEQMQAAVDHMHQLVAGSRIELHGRITRPPKPFTEEAQRLFAQLREVVQELGGTAEWKATGGVCDGNIVASVGLPTIDTLGVVGGGLHTHHEYLEIDSIVPRAKRAALLMLSLAMQSSLIPRK